MLEGFAEIITWGTKSTGGNGLNDQLRAKLFGGNIGHAAIRLTIPIEDAGKTEKMIDELCYHNGQVVLPHTKKKLADGNEVYEVYISAWSNDEVTLDRDFIADSLEELEGVHFNWDPKWAELIQPETRRYKGLVGKSIMTWGPQVIIHQRGNVTDEQFQQLSVIQAFQQNIKQIENYDLLLLRLKALTPSNKSVKFNSTIQILLNKLYPGWKTQIKNPKKISKDELNNIISNLEHASENFEISDFKIASLEKVTAIAKTNLRELIRLIDQDMQKWGNLTPVTAQKINENKALLEGKDNDITLANLVGLSQQGIGQLRTRIQSSMASPNPLPYKLQAYFEYYIPSDPKLLDQNFSYGLPPDHIVKIPLKNKSSNLSAEEGLDPQAMLARAKQVAISNEKFSLTKTNCSKVAGWVLSAGASDKKAKKIFSRDALKLFATPEMVFNNALRYLRRTSKIANQNYDRMVDAVLPKQTEITSAKSPAFVPGFIEISFNGINPALSELDKCRVLLENFEHAIANGTDVPFLSDATKLHVESILKTNEELKSTFYSLCDSSLAKARNQNLQFHEKKSGEWEEVKKIIQQQNTPGKISKKEHPELSRSYIILDINGELKSFRVSSEILGQGAEGKVRVIESEDGLRYAVKISADKASLDSEFTLMQEAGVAIGEFTRLRGKKASKSTGTQIGNKRYVIQPLYEGGELTDALKNKEMIRKDKLSLALKTAQAIQVLHDKSILHRDIKPSNLMVTKDKHGIITNVNVIDFGGALKIPNPPGKLHSSRTGSLAYLAPEIDGEEVRNRARKWKSQEHVVMQLGNMIVEATSHLSELSRELKKLEGQKINDINAFFEIVSGGDTFISLANKQRLIDILANYDGSNQAILKTQAQALATDSAFQDSINSYIFVYCNTIDKIQSVESSIIHFQQKKEDAVLKLDEAKADENKFKKEFNELYSTKTDFSLASDVYSFGIMLQKDFGLKLQDLGLEKMLATEPDERPSMNEVQNILHQLYDPYLSQKISRNIDNTSIRLPDKVDPKTLKENGSLLNQKQMQKLDDIRVDTKNAYVKIDNVTVFLSQEGGAFALHSPIQTGANGSTFLAQNLDTNQWVAIKMVQGQRRKIVAHLDALTKETKALRRLNQLQGTLNIINDNNEMHICIQPYAHGKDYFDVIKQGSLAIEQSVLMSLKAMEALMDIHEKAGYLHRDVKPENILWDAVENKCTFVDFGCAKKGEGPDRTVHDETKQGTEKYAAPEIQFDKRYKEDRVYSIKTDAYSLGVTIKDLLDATTQSDNPAYQQLKQLQERLTAVDPEQRVTLTEALRDLKIIAHALKDQQKAKHFEPLLVRAHSSIKSHLSQSTQTPPQPQTPSTNPSPQSTNKKTLH